MTRDSTNPYTPEWELVEVYWIFFVLCMRIGFSSVLTLSQFSRQSMKCACSIWFCTEKIIPLGWKTFVIQAMILHIHLRIGILFKTYHVQSEFKHLVIEIWWRFTYMVCLLFYRLARCIKGSVISITVNACSNERGKIR